MNLIQYRRVGVATGGTYRIKDGLAPGEVYEVALVPRARNGARQSDSLAAKAVVGLRGLMDQPPDVDNLVFKFQGAASELRWDCIDDSLVAGYEIRIGSHWCGAWVVADCIRTNRYRFDTHWVGSLTFLVKAKTRYGVVSDQAASVTATVPDAEVAQEATSTQDGTWSGTKTGMTVNGSYLDMDTTATSSCGYQSTALTVTQADHRLWVGLEATIIPRDCIGGEMCVLGDGPYTQRHAGGDLSTGDWEGSENLLWGPGGSCIVAGDSLYGEQPGGQRADFGTYLPITVEMRYSQDAGDNYSAWEKWSTRRLPNCDRLQARVLCPPVNPTYLRLRLTGMELLSMHPNWPWGHV